MESTSDVRARQEAAVDKALAALDLDTKARVLGGADLWSLPAVPEIGLSAVVMSDGPIGVRGLVWTGDAALALPSPTAQAASWDVDLARRSGHVLAAEARRKGVHVLLAPTINLHRSPLGGRHFEAFSEDPLLTGAMAAAFVRGVQEGGVACTVKHFVANDAETDRMTVDNLIDERVLRELYLAPFETVVKDGGSWGVMSAYNRVNGPTMTENAALQNGVLRGEWGFDGFIVSDWTASRDTVGSATGGTDVAMPGPVTVYGEPLAAAVRAGDISESVVDERVRAVLRLAARVGALAEAPGSVDSLPAAVDGGAHAREAAARSFVLAKNDGDLLPLAGNESIALIGLPAKEARIMGGGSAQVFPPHIVSPLDGLRAALDDPDRLTFVPAMDARAKLPPVREGFDLRIVARDAAGGELYREPAAEGVVNWLGDLPASLDLATLASVELSGEFTPTETGRHEFAVGGVGDFELSVLGEVRFSGRLDLPEGAHPFSAFVDPPERRVSVDLVADVPVAIALSVRAENVADSPLEGLTFRLGHGDPLPDPDTGIEQAVAAATAAEVAIVFAATTEAVESEGFDRHDLKLPGRQDELVSRVAAANPNTIVVVTAGAPVEMPWLDEARAVLLTWFGGQEFGAALADVLTGVSEPGGRLPTTWPKRLADAPVTTVVPTNGALRYDEGVFIGYRGWHRSQAEPALWFGHGHGYTTWDYRDASLTPAADEDELGRVTVRLSNTGARTGREVVQVYLGPAEPEADRPARWLAGFASVTAEAGETVEAVIPIPRRAAQVWDTDTHDWHTRQVPYKIHIGRSVADIRLTTDVS
ncbi:beta-glucosidase family protein [Stackebrandtia nassauensis]|uniref:Glycoside hydrolase family 3 domain protein n=1 Tax=Stackebrandtia nassauensis (strain DSM 44728 / CIP 108903 / NRRL B-16338 / NBRC 102104 / LLR-40K-21) TaxID=446470 RepID=D3QA87_STANL|nr:glycoside hydrolase family 3 C-terminal domain-containing protein [Stackebrandtia nassauensis]ADD40799.1 glycoside hydrolase family 3 domain protein [Stackebrandtia nassauensis DSM 44728]